MEEKEYIAAIDFGSSRTGCAYSKIKSDIKESDVTFIRFENTGEKIKTLNIVLLNDSNEIIKYGNEIKNFLKQKGTENYHLFKRIKMNLYNNIYKIKADNSSKEISLIEIIYKILDYLKKLIIEAIVKSTKGIQEEYDYDYESNKIRWVLTVPAIWDEQNKYIMMQAAEKAGIVNEKNKNIFFALEPEAASYYCLKKTEELNNNLFNGSYIICDLGGGTGDIVCHEKKNIDGIEKIIEKITPKGGNYGSDEINKRFEDEVLKKIFGENSLNCNVKDYSNGKDYIKEKRNYDLMHLELQEEIDNFKEYLEEEKKNGSFEIGCKLLFKNSPGLDIKSAIENYNKNCREGWKIKNDFEYDEDDKSIAFPNQIIYDLSKEITDKVSDILLEIISDVENDSKSDVENVSTIFYVGGFCNSDLIVNLIKKKIEEKHPNIKQIKSPNADRAVLVGAVYYGLSPERIKSRKAKYTLGMCAYLDWKDEFENGGIKYYDEEFKNYVCQNAFYNFISKNDDIPYDSHITKPFRLRKYGNNKYGGLLIIYKSEKEKVLFVDEESVNEIGRFNFEVNDEREYEYNDDNRIFFVTIELGGTFLNITAYHKNSNTRENMIFKY